MLFPCRIKPNGLGSAFSNNMTTFRILVVDDDQRLTALIRKMLESSGEYEVLEENRSHQVLPAALQFLPDVILMDVAMPGKDGGEIANEIRACQELRNTSILFLTALISKADTGSKTIMRGANEYMAKPVDPAYLKQRLAEILGSRKTCEV